MVPPLKCQELVNRGDGNGIVRLDPNLTAARNRIRDVCDVRPALGHNLGARDFASVHEAGESKISSPKGVGDGSHMLPDLSRARGVHAVPLQDDATTIGQ